MSHTQSQMSRSIVYIDGQENELLLHTQAQVSVSKLYIGGQLSILSHSQLHVKLSYTCNNKSIMRNNSFYFDVTIKKHPHAYFIFCEYVSFTLSHIILQNASSYQVTPTQ